MQSLRDESKSVKKTTSKAEVDQIYASDSKPGPSKQPDDLTSYLKTQPNIRTSDEPMETDICGPVSPPQFGEKIQSEIGSEVNRSDQNSKQSERVCPVKAKTHSDKRKHKVQAKFVSSSSSSEESEAAVQVKKSFKPKRASSDQDKQQTDPDPVFIGR